MTVKSLMEHPHTRNVTPFSVVKEWRSHFDRLQRKCNPYYYLVLKWNKISWRVDLVARDDPDMLRAETMLEFTMISGTTDTQKRDSVSPEELLDTLRKDYEVLDQGHIGRLISDVVHLANPEDGPPMVTEVRHDETILRIPVEYDTVESVFAELIGDQVET